jgi:hypothetical protein
MGMRIMRIIMRRREERNRKWEYQGIVYVYEGKSERVQVRARTRRNGL